MIESLFQTFLGIQGVGQSPSGIPTANSQAGSPNLNQSSKSFASVLGQSQVFQNLAELLSPRADVTRTVQNPLAQLLATVNTEELGVQGSASPTSVDELFRDINLPVLQTLVSSLTENPKRNQIDALFNQLPVIPGAVQVDERVSLTEVLAGLEENIPATLRTANLLLSSQPNPDSSPFLNLSFPAHSVSPPLLNSLSNDNQYSDAGMTVSQTVVSSNLLKLSAFPSGLDTQLLNSSANSSENLLAGTTVRQQTESFSLLKLSFSPEALTSVSLNDSVNGKEGLSSGATIQQATVSSTILRLSTPQSSSGNHFLNESTQAQDSVTPAPPNGTIGSGTRPSPVSPIFQEVEKLAVNTPDNIQVAKNDLSYGNGATTTPTAVSFTSSSSLLPQGVAIQTSQLGSGELAETGLTQGNALLSRVVDGTTLGRVPGDGKIGSIVEGAGVSQRENSGLGTSGNETFLGNQTGSGLSSSGDSQLSSQANASQSVNTARTNALFQEQLQNLNTTPPQRLQIDVQLSEVNRVQLDVGVQQRQVYASLLMDQPQLRNLALQQAPQLGDQLNQIGMELHEFDAEVADHSENTRSTFSEKHTEERPSQPFMSETNHQENKSPMGNMDAGNRGIHLVA